jgi:glutamine amidotransferase
MIAIVDYGMGNLRSVQKALEHVGADARVASSPSDVASAEKVVLPGVGAFEDAMARLREQRLIEPIMAAIAGGRPFLGICLGLQLLMDVSYENGEHTGLGVVAGKVVRFDFDAAPAGPRLRVPQMGWNRVRWDRDCPLLRGVDNGEYMYFAHSYYVAPIDPSVTLTTTDYGIDYPSSVWRENLFATQFHPEKSQAAGLRVLKNFVQL